MDSSLQFSLSLLRDAFAKLLATFELSGITVQSLVRTAGINRSTFYRHFNNINDFTEWLSDQMLEEISSQVILTPEDELDFTEFYQYATKNRLLLSSILTTKGWKEFIIRLHSLVLRRYTLLLKKNISDIPPKIQAEFLIGGQISLFHWWLNQSNPPSTSKMGKYAQQLGIPK